MYKNGSENDLKSAAKKRASLALGPEGNLEQSHETQTQKPSEKAEASSRESKQGNPANERDAHPILNDDDAPASAELLQASEKRGTFKRAAIAACVVLGSFGLVAAVGYFWLLNGRYTDMNYQVSNPQSPANTLPSIESMQGVTEEEIAREIRKPNAANSSLGNQQISSSAAQQQIQSGSPVTDRLPNDNFSATVGPNIGTTQQSATLNAANGTGQSASATGGATAATAETTQVAKDSRPNGERSIRVQLLETRPVSNNASDSPSSPPRNYSDSAQPQQKTAPSVASASVTTVSELAVSPAAIPLPPLGTMLPVRTLGTVFSLRSDSFVRMQLTRDVSGRGWRLKRGTEFYGTLRGSEFESGRAFVSLVGFIDPSTNHLVRLQGNLLDSDGADGVRGHKHKLDSGWARALKMAGAGVVEALSTVASGIGRRPVYVGDIYGYAAPRATGPLAQEISGVAYGDKRRASGFVEVPANTSGYILVMTTPREIQGTDANVSLPPSELKLPSDALSAPRTSAPLSEQEIAELLTSASPDDIRRALPRMSPELRRVAGAVLAQR